MFSLLVVEDVFSECVARSLPPSHVCPCVSVCKCPALLCLSSEASQSASVYYFNFRALDCLRFLCLCVCLGACPQTSPQRAEEEDSSWRQDDKWQPALPQPQSLRAAGFISTGINSKQKVHRRWSYFWQNWFLCGQISHFHTSPSQYYTREWLPWNRIGTFLHSLSSCIPNYRFSSEIQESCLTLLTGICWKFEQMLDGLCSAGHTQNLAECGR